MLNSRQKADDKVQIQANEWRQLAQVVDRLLFCVFLFATIMVSAILLVVVPVYHRYTDNTNFGNTLFWAETNEEKR